MRELLPKVTIVRKALINILEYSFGRMSNVDISRPSTLTTGLSIYPKNIHFKATSFSDSPCIAAARRP